MADLREQTCCFAGHWAFPPEVRMTVRIKAEKAIKNLYDRGVVYYGCGGATGFDTLMAQVCFGLRDSGMYPQMKVILVYPFDGFTKRWSLEQQKTFKVLLKRYDKVVCFSEKPDFYAHLARNKRLVDGSAFCIAYCAEQDGGTAYTVEYAQKKGLEVINLAEV